MLRHAKKLYNGKIAQEERDRIWAEKAEEAAERKARRERDKQARNAAKL